MKKLKFIALILYLSCICHWFAQGKAIEITSDSLLVEQKITFEILKDELGRPNKLLIFEVKVTNLQHMPIPSIRNVIARSNTLELLLNGYSVGTQIQDARQDDGPFYLPSKKSAEFKEIWLIENDSDLYFMPDGFVVRWEYLGISTRPLKVNVIKNTVEELE